MATARWHDWDRRLIGWFLVALLVVAVVVAAPRDGGSSSSGSAASGSTGSGSTRSDAAPTSPARLCGSLVEMAQLRDDLVAATGSTSVEDLRQAARRTRDLGARTRGLDAQAAAGLDYVTGFFVDLPARPTTEQLTSSGAPASITDQAHADAFVSWLQVNCPAQAQ